MQHLGFIAGLVRLGGEGDTTAFLRISWSFRPTRWSLGARPTVENVSITDLYWH